MMSAHFWRWWSLFDSSMSLPIRQGTLFPAAQANSLKFGKHTATIKYRFDLAPLSICHSYRQETAVDWRKGITQVIGLKGRVGSIKIDLHQREEEELIRRPQFGDSKTAMHKKFYLAEIHCDTLDLRAISAIFEDVEKKGSDQFGGPDDSGTGEDYEEHPNYPRATGKELDWIDSDDYCDLGPSYYDADPAVQIIPVLTCPMLTYYRQPNEEHSTYASENLKVPAAAGQGGKLKRSKFGGEGSHTCLVGGAPGMTLTLN